MLIEHLFSSQKTESNVLKMLTQKHSYFFQKYFTVFRCNIFKCYYLFQNIHGTLKSNVCKIIKLNVMKT